MASDLHGIGSGPQLRIFEDLVSDLERFFGVQAHRISIVELWDRDPPEGLEGIDLKEYLSEEVGH